MPAMAVQPRETPAERADAPVEIEVDEALTVHAAQLEEWVAPMDHWELVYREGHEFGKPNNVEARLLLTAPEHTCSLVFRLDQLDSIQEFDRELWLSSTSAKGSRAPCTSHRSAWTSSSSTSSGRRSAARPPSS